MTFVREGVMVGGKELTFETGRMAKQAGGSVVVRYGDSMVLVAATASHKPREGVDFLPLTCDYMEKTSAAGKIPGGYFKREGRPIEQEILTSRLIDRPCRPLFPKGWRFDTQVIAQAVAFDLRIVEVPIHTRYFPEASSTSMAANIAYGLGTLWTMARYRLDRTGMWRSRLFSA